MTIQTLRGEFTVCQVSGLDGLDLSRPYTFAARTDTELSLVCPSEYAPEKCVKREEGWRAFRVQGTLDFSLTGVLAGMASVLAKEGIPIFALSTYDTDYVLVKAQDFSRALIALERKGYEIV